MSKILEKIKTRGYWEVSIRPTEHVEERIGSPGQCKEIVRNLRVSLRGWDYPHYDPKTDPIAGTNYIEQSSEWSFFLEFWRYYQSGQFIHFFGIYEDWQDQAREGARLNLPVTPALSILSALYTITEIYEFASRLAARELLGDQCKISITVHHTQNRQLVMLVPSRHLFSSYICQIETIQRPPKVIPTRELIARSSELSFEHAIWVFQRFNWDNPPLGVLQEDQEKLLEGRL
jgi:hypothetical protein